jgi:hypothetical protein
MKNIRPQPLIVFEVLGLFLIHLYWDKFSKLYRLSMDRKLLNSPHSKWCNLLGGVKMVLAHVILQILQSSLLVSGQ